MSGDPSCGCRDTRPAPGLTGAPTAVSPLAGPVVGIIGAGAAGTLTAMHLLRALGRRGARASIVLIDPAPATGRGVAYSTEDDRHLLNVPAAGMSAFPDEPDHLLDWARAHHDADTGPGEFLPRRVYGTYLADTLRRELAAASTVDLHRVTAHAVDLQERHRSHWIQLCTGGTVVAGSVVLATGNNAPGTGWAPPALLASPRFVVDPWSPGALPALAAADGDVLLVGTRLTMVDVALSAARPGRMLYAVSRHGRLPTVHAAHPQPGVEPTDLPDELDLDGASLREAVLAHVRRTVRETGDWRPAIDGLRAHTGRLWSALCDDCRADFLRQDASGWDVHRHRMPRRTAAAVSQMRAAGALQVATGEVVAVDDDGSALVVHLSDGTTRRVGYVVNCTGPLADVELAGDPLLTALLDHGRAVPGPVRMGLATDRDGRVRAADHSVGSLWTLGTPRRGELWESTAIPEIRAQAATIAEALVGALAVPGRRRPRDLMGLSLSTSAAAAAAYNDGLGRVLRVQSGADDAFRRAAELDPGFALAHAALALLGHEGGAGGDVSAYLAAAQGAVRARGDDRERSLVDVITRRVQDCRGGGATALVHHIEAYPRDALAVSAAVPTIAFSGVTDVQQEAWALVEGLAPAYGDDWWYAGLLAFVRQDQGRYDEAAALAGSALRIDAASGHAVHAQTHVYYETGQHVAGLQWLSPWIATSGRGASHRAHFSWHAALHELSLGDLDALHRRYDGELAPPHVTGVRALVDSASLLWRCRMTGSWTEDLPLPAVLELVGVELLERPSTPFTAMHAALALAAAGDVAGLSRLRAHAAATANPVMTDVVVSLCDALVAVVEARWCEAVRVLRLLGPWLVQLGGSAAQREIVEDTLLHALIGARRCDEARALLEARLDRRPSPLDRQRLRRVPV
ncbi:MAG: FAD/NAD(P)-binding protein [Oryzihumus sp.]